MSFTTLDTWYKWNYEAYHWPNGSFGSFLNMSWKTWMNLLVNPIFERWPPRNTSSGIRPRDKEGKAASKGNVIKQVYRWAPAEFNSPEELCKPIQNACLKVIAPARKETGEYLDTNCISLEMGSAPGRHFWYFEPPRLVGCAGSSIQHKLKGRQLKVGWSTVN